MKFSLLLALGLVASPGRIINFDADALGKIPPGWSAPIANGGSASRWEVLRDRTAPTQPYVLAQLSEDPRANRFPLAILNAVDLRDGDVSVRLKPVAGLQDESGGVVFRYRDADNYYLALADARQQEVALFKVENGQRFPIGSVKHDVPANAWRILKISLAGPRIPVRARRSATRSTWRGSRCSRSLAPRRSSQRCTTKCRSPAWWPTCSPCRRSF